MMDLVDLAKSAAAESDEARARVSELEKAVAQKQPTTEPMFDKSSLLKLAGKAHLAGLVPANEKLEKVADTIASNPLSFMNYIIQAQMPPESQGEPFEKEASKLSGDNVLVDYDGWLECLPTD